MVVRRGMTVIAVALLFGLATSGAHPESKCSVQLGEYAAALRWIAEQPNAQPGTLAGTMAQFARAELGE